jgi:serine/threonine protein kinase
MNTVEEQIKIIGGGTNLISQGAYGCIFRPGFFCNGRAIHSDKYITKIQRKKGTSDHEAEIGEIIRKIPHYDDYFAPILEKPCLINMASIHDNEIKKCDFLKTMPNTKAPFESNRIKYIGKYTLANSLLIDYNTYPKTIVKKLVESHIYLLNAYKKLNDAGVIHFDVKENNIICEDNSKKPIIIDFGLSIKKNDIKSSTLQKIFFVYGPDYGPWPIEVHIICYIINELGENWRKQPLTKEIFKTVIIDVCKKNLALVDLFTEQERKKYYTHLQLFFDKYVNKSGEEVVNEILKLKQTWDNYAVAVIFLYIIKDMHLNDYIEHSEKLNTYVNYLKYIIVCMPDKRPQIQNTKEHIVNIFKQVDRKEEKRAQQKIHNQLADKKHIVKENIEKTQSKHLKQENHIYTKK